MIELMLYSCFWSSVLILVYIYAGYPLTLYCFATIANKPVSKRDYLPSVTILISAYNEEGVLSDCLENKLSLDYPRDKLSILVVSDGSTDRTDRIVRDFAARDVNLLKLDTRQGKTSAINAAMGSIESEVVVFADANSMYTKKAVLYLVENLGDETVGYVTGHMDYAVCSGTVIETGCSTYMKYENCLRSLETRCGSIVGVDGGIDAMRRELYSPLPPEVEPDVVLPLNTVKQKLRVVYEPRAILYEQPLSTSKDEYKMRVRLSLRSLYSLYVMRGLLNPLKYGFFAFQLFVHKLLRYGAGLFMLAALLVNAALINASSVYLIPLTLQLVFYLFVCVGYFTQKSKLYPLLYFPFYFYLLNYASLVGAIKLCAGTKLTVWEPRKGV